MRRIPFILIYVLLFFSCKTKTVDSIIIGHTLYTHQSFQENNRMSLLIKKTLKKDANALIELKNFPNGGGHSSYDLGYVITQIIYRIGEDDFLNLVKQFPDSETNFQGLIDVGLEYGDNDYDGQMDNKKFKEEFSDLYKYLNK